MREALKKLQDAARQGARSAAATRENVERYRSRGELARKAAEAMSELTQTQEELALTIGARASLRDRLGIALNKTPLKVNEIVLKWDDDSNGSINKEEFRRHAAALMGIDGRAGRESSTKIDALFDELDEAGIGALFAEDLKVHLRSIQESGKEAHTRSKQLEKLLGRLSDAARDKQDELTELLESDKAEAAQVEERKEREARERAQAAEAAKQARVQAAAAKKAEDARKKAEFEARVAAKRAADLAAVSSSGPAVAAGSSIGSSSTAAAATATAASAPAAGVSAGSSSSSTAAVPTDEVIASGSRSPSVRPIGRAPSSAPGAPPHNAKAEPKEAAGGGDVTVSVAVDGRASGGGGEGEGEGEGEGGGEVAASRGGAEGNGHAQASNRAKRPPSGRAGSGGGRRRLASTGAGPGGSSAARGPSSPAEEAGGGGRGDTTRGGSVLTTIDEVARGDAAVASSSTARLAAAAAAAAAAPTAPTVSYRCSGPGLHAATLRGEPQTFTIECIDTASGERKQVVGETFFVAVRGPARARAKVVDRKDGTYAVEWRPPCSGNYSIAVSKFGVALPGSPFNVIASSPEPYAPNCVVRGGSLTRAVALEAQAFEVLFKDKLGQVTHAVDLDIFVELVPPSSPRRLAAAPPSVSPSSSGAAVSADAETELAAAGMAAGGATTLTSAASAPPPAATALRGRRGGVSSPMGQHRKKVGGEGEAGGGSAVVAAKKKLGGGRTELADGSTSASATSHARASSTAAHGMPSIPSTMQVAVEQVPAPSMADDVPIVDVEADRSMDADKAASTEVVETRNRKIRVKVGANALVLRCSFDPASEAIGRLAPGTILTVLEERFCRDGSVHACIALDAMGKEGVSDRGLTFRSKTFGRSDKADEEVLVRTAEGLVLVVPKGSSPLEGSQMTPASSSRSALSHRNHYSSRSHGSIRGHSGGSRGGGSGVAEEREHQCHDRHPNDFGVSMASLPHDDVAATVSSSACDGSGRAASSSVTYGMASVPEERDGSGGAASDPPLEAWSSSVKASSGGLGGVAAQARASSSKQQQQEEEDVAPELGGAGTGGGRGLEGPTGRKPTAKQAPQDEEHTHACRHSDRATSSRGESVLGGYPASTRDTSSSARHYSGHNRLPPPDSARRGLERIRRMEMALSARALSARALSGRSRLAASASRPASCSSQEAGGPSASAASSGRHPSTGVAAPRGHEDRPRAYPSAASPALAGRVGGANVAIASNAVAADDTEELRDGRVGWVTLMSNGSKLVSSRLRLDLNSRGRLERQWQLQRQLREGTRRGVASEGAASDKEKAKDKESKTAAASRSVRADQLPFDRNNDDGLSVMDDPTGFAFGGIYPGVLHAHGKLVEAHKVSYSIGVSGVYLLHVRLHNQAVSLPGSPFTLQVDPGAAFALSSRVPALLEGEVGEERTTALAVADMAGNICHFVPRETKAADGADELMDDEAGDRGRSSSQHTVVTCTSPDSELEAKAVQNADGTFTLSWLAQTTGTYETHVKVNGLHVINSPSRIVMRSTRPVIGKSQLSGPGLADAEEKKPTTIRVLLFDSFGNVATPDPATFLIGMSLVNLKERKSSKEEQNASLTMFEGAVGEWREDDERRTVFELTYTPDVSGVHQLFVWCDPEGKGERKPFAGMPLSLNIDKADSSDLPAGGRDAEREAAEEGGEEGGATKAQADAALAKQRALTSASKVRGAANGLEKPTYAPGDYTVDKEVFEEAKNRWGQMSIDAFASEATAMLPRYWTELPSSNSEGTDAMKQDWPFGERIWAHPPTDKLVPLIQKLKAPERAAEVIVCAPLWKSSPWFLDLVSLCDDKVKYRAGKLSRVADDAPDRLEGWPLMVFHIPGKKGKGRPPSRANSPVNEAEMDTGGGEAPARAAPHAEEAGHVGDLTTSLLQEA